MLRFFTLCAAFAATSSLALADELAPEITTILAEIAAEHETASIAPAESLEDGTSDSIETASYLDSKSKSCDCGHSVVDCGCGVGGSSIWDAPAMIGDYFGGYGVPIGGAFEIDRLMVLASDLDAPVILPPAGSPLTITEAGPVPITSGATSVQQIQAALRAGDPLPTLTLEGNVADSRTLTTQLTITQIQTLLASSADANDIIPVVMPPASYGTAVDALFATRNTAPGTTTFDANGSGALLQAGADTLNGGEDLDAFYFYAYNAQLAVPTPGSAFGNQGRLKVSTGNSPLPRNRVYFRYGLFDGVAGPAGDITVNRFTPGFEKTFYNDLVSFELRTPYAATVSNVGSLGSGGVAGTDVLFGNVALFAKGVLIGRENFALSGGMGISLPTADDVNVSLADGTPLVGITNDSVHLKPFLSALYAKSSGLFAQGFLEIDVDTNGDPVSANLGSGLTGVGTLYDATYLFADVGVGYRYVKPFSCVKAISPTVELHYNSALESPNHVQAGLLQIGGLGTNLHTLNMTVGATAEIDRSTNLSAGYIVPIGGGADQQLDGGFRVSLEYRPW